MKEALFWSKCNYRFPCVIVPVDPVGQEGTEGWIRAGCKCKGRTFGQNIKGEPPLLRLEHNEDPVSDRGCIPVQRGGVRFSGYQLREFTIRLLIHHEGFVPAVNRKAYPSIIRQILDGHYGVSGIIGAVYPIHQPGVKVKVSRREGDRGSVSQNIES